jgi:predicted phage terminase large subunit-like protein
VKAPEPSRLEKAKILRRLILLKAAEETFLGFVKLLHPDYTLQPFQLDLIDKLDRLERGALVQPAASNWPGQKVMRLLVTMPPRAGKSWLVSWLFPVWYMARRPARSVLASSYNYELANDFGRRSRDYALLPEVGQAFPNFKLTESASDLWRTSLSGQYAGVGLQGTTTGRPANLLLVDDPIKNRLEADSPRNRHNVWSFYESALSPRREPLMIVRKDGTTFHDPAIEVVVLTRWHPDDMAGRLIDSREWKDGLWMHVNYPAITLVKDEKPIRRDRLDPDHPMHMDNAELPSSGKGLHAPSGQMRRIFDKEAFFWPTHEVALWEERFPLVELHRRRQQNAREFAALYMQTPYIAGGNLFKEKWWKYYDAVPTKNEISAIVIGADTAMMTGKQNDFTVLCVLALLVTGDMYVLDVIRGKWEFPDLKRQVLLLNARYRGMGLRAFYIEDRNSGASLIQELKRETNVPVIPHKVVFDKRMRAELVTPLIESGLVYLPREALWLDDFLAELAGFPGGRNDDQVDALVIALDRMAKTPRMDEAMLSVPLSAHGSLNSQADRILSQPGTGSSAAFGRDLDQEPHRPFVWGE